jgi:hypothetical protein
MQGQYESILVAADSKGGIISVIEERESGVPSFLAI